MQAAVLGTYTDRASWEALTTSRTDINFSSLNLTPGGYQGYNTSSGLTLGGVQFIGWNGSSYFLYALNPPSGADEDYNSGTILKGPEWYPNCYLLSVMPANITSVGFDLATVFPGARNIRIQIDGNDLGVVVTLNRPNLTFYGVQTDTPIGQIRFLVDSGTQYQTMVLLDNFAYGIAAGGGGGGGGGGPAETVEATTLLYAATGLALVIIGRRRHRRSETQSPLRPWWRVVATS